MAGNLWFDGKDWVTSNPELSVPKAQAPEALPDPRPMLTKLREAEVFCVEEEGDLFRFTECHDYSYSTDLTADEMRALAAELIDLAGR